MKPLALAVLVLAGLAAAARAEVDDTRLQALLTGDEVRGWEAVGRLDIDGKGFCTAALISETRILTAAHCLYETDTGQRIDPSRMEFLAGLRNGRALAYRDVRRAAQHPDYVFTGQAVLETVALDVAILELARPIRSTRIVPFAFGDTPQGGHSVGIVSYALDRAEAPSLQETCTHLGQQGDVLVMSCDVDFGSSGAPVFSMTGDVPTIVSVVSAKAEMNQQKVALGMMLDQVIPRIEAALVDGGGDVAGVSASTIRVIRPGQESREISGARFVRP